MTGTSKEAGSGPTLYHLNISTGRQVGKKHLSLFSFFLKPDVFVVFFLLWQYFPQKDDAHF